MKKFNLFKMLAVLIVLITSINTAWGWAVWGNLYYNTSNQGWSDVTLVIGRSGCSKAYSFMHLNNTNLYYQWVYFDSYNDMYFIGERWDNDSDCNPDTPYDRVKNISHWQPWKGDYNESENNDGKTAKNYYFNGDYTAGKWYNIPYKTATVKVKTSVEGAAYTTITEGTWPAVINLKGTYMASYPATTGQSNFNTTSGDKAEYSDIPISGEVTMTLGADQSSGDFVFEGWGTGDEPTITETPHTYNIDDNTTYYAFFRSPMYHVRYNANGGSGSMDNQSFYLNVADNLTTNAFTKTNYSFQGWATSQANANARIVAYTNEESVSGLGDEEGEIIDLYAVWQPQWCVKGFDDWDDDHELTFGSGTTHSGTVDLAANTTYEFKVFDRNSSGASAWYGYETSTNYITFTREGTTSQSGLDNNKNNLKITTDIAETYTFSWNTEGEVISVTFPTPEYDINYYDQGGTSFTGTQAGAPTKHTYGTDTDLEIPTREGYDFAGWFTASDCASGQVGTTSAATLGATDYTADIDLYAKWTPKTTTINLHYRGATGSASISSVTATYDANTLTGGTPVPSKWGNTFGGWFTNTDGTGTEVITSAGALKASAGDYTDGSRNWQNTDASIDLYAKWTPKDASSISLINHTSTPAATSGGATFNETGTAGLYYVKVDTDNGYVFHLGDGTAAAGPSSSTNITLASDAQSITTSSNAFTHTGAKQTIVYVLDVNDLTLSFQNFVIGASGGKTAYGVNPSFSGDIYGVFELRMAVGALDTWSTLCLPFSPTNVQVWEDAYYDIVPFWRPDKTLLTGHYIIRYPTSTTLSISDFSDGWHDPTSDSFKPAGGQPYIIQWHDGYFSGKYITFWGGTAGNKTTIGGWIADTAPDAEGVVKICGNASLSGGSIAGAYVMSGSSGEEIWQRDENVEKLIYIEPMGCYLLAAAETTKSNAVIRRRTGGDTPTGWEDVLNTEPQTKVSVYTITGFKVAEFDDCSFTQAGRHLQETYSEGIFILRAGNESVKLMIGGK